MWLSRLALFEELIWTEIQMEFPVDSTGVRNSSPPWALCYCRVMKMSLLEADSAPWILRGCLWSVCAAQWDPQMYCNIFCKGWDCLGTFGPVHHAGPHHIKLFRNHCFEVCVEFSLSWVLMYEGYAYREEKKQTKNTETMKCGLRIAVIIIFDWKSIYRCSCHWCCYNPEIT